MSTAGPSTTGTLLVVDDEVSLVTALLSTLRQEGFTAIGATQPSEALEIIRRQPVDVVLTDLHLPEMDGIALLRAVLEIDPTIMVILMTGFATIDTAVDAMKAGAIDYIVKPFKLKSVLAVLDRALAVRRLRRENELLTRRLEQRTQQLEEMNRELEAFSYSVSHDLRAPLRAIEGFTESLIEDCQQGRLENLDEYGRRIRRGVHRMASMIQDLLHLATAARAEVNRSEVDLARFAVEALGKLAAESPGRAVETIVPPEVIVYGDPGLLQLVIENLLANAWKYSARAAAPRIELGVRDEPGETVVFVRDNGVGFDPAEAGRLFVPFQRLSTAVGFDGSGIGLATVARIVRRHGGRIWAEAEPGKGATFSFSLPKREAGAASATPAPAASG